jgi:hypothetical protein
MRKTILLVAVVLSLFVFALPAQAQDAPLWHCDAVTVTAQSGGTYRVVATGAGAYWRIKAVGGSTVAGPQQSPTFANVALSEGAQYQVQAADAAGGPWSNNAACLFTVAPLAVVIDAFNVYCEPGGVRLEWSVSTEAVITRYLVTRNGDTFLNVPADCPGCTGPASYTRNVETLTPNGMYTLLAYNGDGLIDVEEAGVTGCGIPTASRLSSFTATARRWWQR